MAKTKSSDRDSRGTQKGGSTPPPSPPAAPVKAAPLFRRIDWLTLLLTSVVMYVAYIVTLAPELTLQDSGELAVGSYYAGVPHPPGYPVWTIYTWLWTVLLPFGNVAWRVAMGEAAAGALAAGFLALIVSRGSSMLMEGIEQLKDMTGKWESAICMVSGSVAGLLMGFNGFMWSQSVIVEVYLFGVLSFMLVLTFLLRWIYAPHQMRYAYWALFMFGVCFTNHQSLIVAAIGVEVAIAAGNPKLGRDVFFGNFVIYLLYNLVSMYIGHHVFANLGAKPGLLLIFHTVGVGSLVASCWLMTKTKGFLSEWRHVAILGSLWILGASFYFYMPISGMTNPPIQWGYPRTVEGFLHALERGQYEQPNPTNLVTEPGRFLNQLLMLFGNVGDEFSLVYAFLAIVPFIFFRKMQKRERAWMIGLIAIYLCLGVLLMILLNPNPDRASADLVKVFFTASHTVVAAMVGYGLALTAAFMATHYQSFRSWGLMGGAAAVILAIYELLNDTHKVYLGEAASWNFSQVMAQIGKGFNANQYGLPVWAGIILLAMTVIFLGAVWFYHSRAPLGIALGLFALMPLNPMLNNWSDNEQRGHMFGYWFGHDMFTPPFKGKDGKSLYPEMTKDAVLYGGTDPGRFCPTYMIFCESFIPHKCQPPEDQKFDRRDVYIITQNALADGTYLNYIRAHYNRSKQIDPPFFQELFRSAKEREQNYETNLLARMVSPLDTIFEGIGERVEKRRRTYTSWFTENDFTDFPAFAARLRPGPSQDAVSKFLFDNLSPTTQKRLTDNASDTAVSHAVASDLNVLIDRELEVKKQIEARQQEKSAVEQRIADGNSSDSLVARKDKLAGQIADLSKIPPLYDADRFKGVAISEYLQDFIAQNPQSHTRVRLNRLLLEAAYPKEIAKSLGGVYPDREMYIASNEDSSRCFNEYMGDAQRRLQSNQLKPGEDVKYDKDSGRVQVSGQVAVMAINGLLTKVMFDQNPKNEFFVEESFPLDWMYPHLTPFGIIMKINRQPLVDLSDDILDRDHQFWKEYSKRLTGDFIDYDTPIKQITDWIEKTYLRRDFNGFTGDRKFIRDNDAQKAFSKLRSSIGGVYAWRLAPGCPQPYRPKNDAQFQRLLREADFTFRQAFAFCPYSPEAVYRYVNLLLQLQRLDDALLIAQTCLKLDPYNGSILGLVSNLQSIKSQQTANPQPRSDLQFMAEELKRNPTNLQMAVEMARGYLQLQQTGRASQILDGILAQPTVPASAIVRAAQLYGQMGAWQKLETSLERLVKISPESPEAWYDLAGFKANLGKSGEAMPALTKALDLSAARLQTNAKALDLANAARSDERFARLRQTPEFQKLLPTKQP
jgi:tetratricopeptide (TPR) repeat protein